LGTSVLSSGKKVYTYCAYQKPYRERFFDVGVRDATIRARGNNTRISEGESDVYGMTNELLRNASGIASDLNEFAGNFRSQIPAESHVDDGTRTMGDRLPQSSATFLKMPHGRGVFAKSVQSSVEEY
jgi:hypothetical protein